MAKGDTKSARPSRGGWGSTRTSVYNDQGRGHSSTLWEIFEREFTAASRKMDWLAGGLNNGQLADGLYDGWLLKAIHNMVSRYNLHDWAWRKFEDTDSNDGRVRRIVIKHCDLTTWHQLQERAKQLWDKEREEQERRDLERSQEFSQQQAVFEAERIKRQKELVQEVTKEVDLVSGALRSDFLEALSERSVYNQDEGEWLDDVVSAHTSGFGFGSEERQADGVKMQITLSLDTSNSMYHNGVADVAARTFRDVYLALEQLADENTGDLFVAAFEFAKDGYEESDAGRIATNLTINTYKRKDGTRHWDNTPHHSTDTSLGAVNKYKDSSNTKWQFSGEDTWFYTLFEEIEAWENKFSDPRAHRLDLVISDAVIEHPSDIRRSDVIQERRDGSLQTVILNFLPEREWVNSDLPKRCVQYPANKDNIAGMLRTIITEFVGAHL